MSTLEPHGAGLRIGLIGAGRLGSALAQAIHHSGLPMRALASRSAASAQRLAAVLPGCRVLDAQAVVDACDMVFLTTPDDALPRLAASLRWRPGIAAVHCSGASELTVLAAAQAAGAAIGGFHPLQSFAAMPPDGIGAMPPDGIGAMPPDGIGAIPPEGSAAPGGGLSGCTVTIEAEPPLDTLLQELVLRLGARINRLPPGMRGRYHAAAGYASQFVHVLLREAGGIWQSWGASEDDAVVALLPLLAGTIVSVQRAGVAGGMPGPVSRGDEGTLGRHLQALAPLPPATQALYRELCGRSVALALESGAIDVVTARRIRGLLNAPATDSRHDGGIDTAAP
jgi:predicted short-subunit dehydrogenase-like oxidoreductase (DUF2520 family)